MLRERAFFGSCHGCSPGIGSPEGDLWVFCTEDRLAVTTHFAEEGRVGNGQAKYVQMRTRTVEGAIAQCEYLRLFLNN